MTSIGLCKRKESRNSEATASFSHSIYQKKNVQSSSRQFNDGVIYNYDIDWRIFY
jgi:hypothetical protein